MSLSDTLERTEFVRHGFAKFMLRPSVGTLMKVDVDGTYWYGGIVETVVEAIDGGRGENCTGM